jgi:hypothetical protein
MPPEALTPAVQDLMPQADALTASARKAELMADPEWRSRYIKGEGPEREEMAALNAKLAPPPPTLPVDPTLIDHLRDAGLSEAAVEQYKAGKPIPQAERAMVERWVKGHVRDPSFRQKYLDGDWESRRLMRTANMMMSLPVEGA